MYVMAIKFIRKHINEGYFNNPDQAKAARARRAQSSNAELVAKQTKEIFENNLREICDKILLQSPERNRVKKVTLENDKIVLDLEYVQADTHTYNVETSFCGSTIKYSYREGKRSARTELLYEAVAGIAPYESEGSKFINDRKNIIDRTNAYIVAAARRMLYKDDAENQPEYEYYKSYDELLSLKEDKTNFFKLQEGNKFKSNVLRYDKIYHGSLHPTQKPVDLLEDLILTYTNKGDTVLDFTMGSGSTGVACQNLNRDFIGIELDEEYFKVANERINNCQSRLI